MTPNLDPTSECRLRALVLDSDGAAQRAARRSLERAGFDVLCAGDGERGLALLLSELLRLDVLVVDVDLPGRDARALARLIRGAGGERDLAIVVPARDLTPSSRAELLAEGVDAVVDRSEGPRAVATAALAAVAKRTAAHAEPEASPAPAAWARAWLAAFERWSPIAA